MISCKVIQLDVWSIFFNLFTLSEYFDVFHDFTHEIVCRGFRCTLYINANHRFGVRFAQVDPVVIKEELKAVLCQSWLILVFFLETG